MAAHGTNPDTDTIDRNRFGITEDLVGFGIPLPLFSTLTIFNFAINPWQQASGQGIAKFFGRQDIPAQ